MAEASSTLKEKFLRGLKEYLIITLYLWLIFVLFQLYRSALVSQYHLDLVERGFALINALALGKIALVAKELKMDARLRRPEGKPLIYSTLLNTAAFAFLMTFFKILEQVAVGMFHGKSVAQSVTELGGTWQGTLCLAAIFFVMLIPFFAFTELDTVLGKGKLARLFFREHKISEGKLAQ